MTAYTHWLQMSSDLYVRDAVVPVGWQISLNFQVQTNRLQNLHLSLKTLIYVNGSETTTSQVIKKKYKNKSLKSNLSKWWSSLRVRLWPVHLEVAQPHSHFIHNRWDCRITFKGLLGKTILDRQKTKISYNDIWRGRRLREEDNRCVEVDAESDSRAPLCQFLHAWGCLFCSLNCHLSQGLFSLLEVINKCLGGEKK